MVKILVDISYSMMELGKKDILEIVIKSIIDDFKRNNIDFKVIDFNGNEIKFSKIDFRNVNFNSSIVSEDDIVLTDGFLKLEKNQANAIAIGIDSDIEYLKKIFKNVFLVEEIFYLLDLYKRDEEDEDEW